MSIRNVSTIFTLPYCFTNFIMTGVSILFFKLLIIILLVISMLGISVICKQLWVIAGSDVGVWWEQEFHYGLCKLISCRLHCICCLSSPLRWIHNDCRLKTCNTKKELSLRNKTKYLIPNIFRTRWCKPFIFQTQIILSNRIHSLKYLDPKI